MCPAVAALVLSPGLLVRPGLPVALSVAGRLPLFVCVLAPCFRLAFSLPSPGGSAGHARRRWRARWWPAWVAAAHVCGSAGCWSAPGSCGPARCAPRSLLAPPLRLDSGRGELCVGRYAGWTAPPASCCAAVVADGAWVLDCDGFVSSLPDPVALVWFGFPPRSTVVASRSPMRALGCGGCVVPAVRFVVPVVCAFERPALARLPASVPRSAPRSLLPRGAALVGNCGPTASLRRLRGAPGLCAVSLPFSPSCCSRCFNSAFAAGVGGWLLWSNCRLRPFPPVLRFFVHDCREFAVLPRICCALPVARSSLPSARLVASAVSGAVPC